MRKTILCLFLTLLASYPAFSQDGRTFYKVCGTERSMPDTNAEQDKIDVRNFSDDSITFVTNASSNFAGNSYTAQRVANHDFLITGDDRNNTYNFYVYKADDNSFYMLSSDTATWAYYHTNQKLAYEKDNDKRCGLETIQKFTAAARLYKTQPEVKAQPKAPDPVTVARTKAIFTDFVKNYQSKMNDPALNRDLLQWWQTAGTDAASIPILHIYILQPSFGFLRNNFGIVTGKLFDAMILYKSKKDNTCFAGYRTFGYEALGGTFDSQIKQYPAMGNFLNLPEERAMSNGEWYEVDCAAFQPKPSR